MPRGDQTGPNGAGAMSGRRMGFCAGNNVAGFQSNESDFRGQGRFGFRHRFGRGNNYGFGGYGFRYCRDLFPSEPVNKKSFLEEQIKNIKNQLNDLEDQFKTLA